jgi:hypothetical protein
MKHLLPRAADDNSVSHLEFLRELAGPCQLLKGDFGFNDRAG